MRRKFWPIQNPIRNFTICVQADGLATVRFREPPPRGALQALSKLPGVWQVSEQAAFEWTLAANPRYETDRVFQNALDVLMGREPQRIRVRSGFALVGPQECLWRHIIIILAFIHPALRGVLLNAPHVAWVDDEGQGFVRVWASTRVAGRRKPLDGALIMADLEHTLAEAKHTLAEAR